MIGGGVRGSAQYSYSIGRCPARSGWVVVEEYSMMALTGYELVDIL
jgi:hypothetical protein